MARLSLLFGTFIFSLCFLLVHCEELSNHEGEPNCSRMCVAKDCNTLGIRYGKYCGVGWTGCAGEEPCDDLDKCCKKHDDCVTLKGITEQKCHEKFKKCMRKVSKSGKPGFTKECLYKDVIPLMTQGMDMAIIYSQMSS